jgi:hypothetical protein
MAMDFVGDYAKQKKLAELLRKQQESYAGVDTGPSAYTTRGSGAFPGMTQASWGGALAKLGQGYLGGRADAAASAAEEEQKAARMKVLSGLTGKESAADLIATGEGIDAPGITEKGIDLLVPAKEKLANFLQAISSGAIASPQAAAMLAPQFGIDPAEAGKMVTDYQTRQTADLKEKEASQIRVAKGSHIVDPSKASALGPLYAKWAAMPPGPEKDALGAQIAQGEAFDNVPKNIPGGANYTPGQANLYSKEILASDHGRETINSLQAQEPLVDALLSNPDDFSVFSRFAQKMSAGGNGMGSESFSSKLGEAVAAGEVPASAVVLNQVFNDAIKENLKAAGGSDSNMEMLWARNALPSMLTSQAAAQAGWERIKLMNKVTARAAEMKHEDFVNGVYMTKAGKQNYFNDAAAELGFERGPTAWAKVTDIVNGGTGKKDPRWAPSTGGATPTEPPPPQGVPPEVWSQMPPEAKAEYNRLGGG